MVEKANDKSKSNNNNLWREEREKNEFSATSILLFGLIGATATTIAVGQLRTTVDWLYNHLKSSSWRNAAGSSYRGSFREEARRKYSRRMQEEYEDEMERVERIKRMQSVFNRERSKRKKTYERWEEHGPHAYQHFQRDDWYWKTDTSYKDQRRTNFRSIPRESGNYALSHHYSVLGLDRLRTTPYTEAEIKTAFRAKAMEFHPDQNQDNKEAAEAKFKEVMTSYEAIKSERENRNC